VTRLVEGSCVFLVLAAVGCNAPAPAGPPPAAPEVLVSLPVTREITDYEDFPGRVEAINSIDVRARVTGYLDRFNFREGEEVKQGEVLFEIDVRPYQAELNRAEANVVQAQARLNRLEADAKRAEMMFRRGAIGQEELDKVTGDRAEAGAAVGVARANRDLAALNVGFTRVQAPISGRITRRNIDPGNLVKADDTVLATIVSLDPIYAYFDVDERTTLRLQRLIREGAVEWSPDKGLEVLLGLADEDSFPRRGTVTYTDPRIDPETGTWRLRGEFANRTHVLSPGMYVRVRLPVGRPYTGLAVAEQALGTDQGQKFVYVVDDAGEVSYRRVKVGRLHEGFRIIADGLAPGEKVVVSGLQRIRQGVKVQPKVVEMPGQNPKSETPSPKEKENSKSEARNPKETGNKKNEIRNREGPRGATAAADD
jgi:RND family efflux transporter MFP subunit